MKATLIAVSVSLLASAAQASTSYHGASGDAERSPSEQATLLHQRAERDVAKGDKLTTKSLTDPALAAKARESYDRALEALAGAVQLYPRHAASYELAGLIYLRLAQPDEALKTCRQATSIDERLEEARACEVRALLTLGQGDEARAVIASLDQGAPKLAKQVRSSLQKWVKSNPGQGGTSDLTALLDASAQR